MYLQKWVTFYFELPANTTFAIDYKIVNVCADKCNCVTFYLNFYYWCIKFICEVSEKRRDMASAVCPVLLSTAVQKHYQHVLCLK